MSATIRYVAAHCGFGGFVPPEPALAFPGLQQMVEMHRHQTHQRSGEVREETHLAQPCPGGCCQPGGHRAGSPGSTTKEIPSWVRTPVAPAKLPGSSPLCATFCWVSYTSSPPLCFAVFVASPPIPCPSIAGSVGVYDKSLETKGAPSSSRSPAPGGAF